jgi:hypothetical protein
MNESEITPRRVKIGAEERGGWSSERPQGDGQRARVREHAHVLSAAAELRYSPRSLIVVSAADAAARTKLLARTLPPGVIISRARICVMLNGRVEADQIEAVATQLFEDTLRKRLVDARPAVVESETLTSDERLRLVEIADMAKRSAHLIVLDIGRQALGDDEVFYQLQSVVATARSGEIGREGFRTSLVLGRSDIEALRVIEFVLPRAR